MIRKAIIISLFSAIISSFALAQEVVIGLQSNYALTRLGNNNHKGTANNSAVMLELPFFDDFSGRSVYPDSSKWSDNFVFINNTYSDKQVTTGVATMDAIDNTGRLYETAIASGFAGDMLTTHPLNLEYPASDNVMLSFYYQAGGLGDSPEPNDSLTLLFLAPEENKWYSVWRANGTTDKSFRQTVVPVNDQRFLKKGFQFRFINYATISENTSDQSMIANCDHWNLDYIYLNRNRTENDTVYSDVAFRSGIRSLLKSHEAIPLNQFREIELQEMGAFIPIHYRNNDIIVRNVTRNFEIWDVYRKIKVHSFSAGATNIDPLTNVDYSASLIYTFKSDSPDSARFRVICSLKTDDFDPKANDTVTYDQVFSNYLAFDDGSAEMGYGINGQGSRNAMVATRFTSFIEDTIRSVQICFNDSYRDANKRSFDLLVWSDNNGTPGDVIYRGEELMVTQSGRINGFYTYGIPDGVPVNGVFYIGWKQRSETFLNAGIDINTAQNGKQFYWLNGNWQQSQVKGTLMIRPVVGSPPKTTSIDDLYGTKDYEIMITPNPAREFIKVTTAQSDNGEAEWISISDLSGRKLLTTRNSGQIDISSLHQGIYIVITSISGRPTGYSRFIKVK